MSDTDDTDDLLLIPPDFFTVHSDSEHSNTVEPYYTIVDSLIKQVNNLQDRIQFIESSSDGFLSNSLDHWFEHSNMQNLSGFHKYNSTDDLYNSQSTQSTPQKPRTKFKLNSLPATPSANRFSPEKSPFKSQSKVNLSPKNNKEPPNHLSVKEDEIMLNEVDTFLSKVKTIQRLNAARNLENDFNSCATGGFEKNNNSKEQQDSKVNDNKEEKLEKQSTWRVGDNKESVPDYGAGVRDSLYNQHNNGPKHKNQQKAFSNQSTLTTESVISTDKYPLSDSSSDSTCVTAFQNYSKNRSDLLSSPLHTNALNVISMHKQLLEDGVRNIKVKGKAKEHKFRGNNTLNDNLGLLRLADIWSTSSYGKQLNPDSSRLSQKLQEEKLRRQHCEELIQELQNRNLEMEQKLSVAVKVDESKNSTIHHFQEVLEKIVTRLEKLNNDKQELDNDIRRLKDKHAEEMKEASQKIVYYENEASKALHLAHGNQEKISSLEKRCIDLQNEVKSTEKRFQELQDTFTTEMEKSKQLSEILSRKEIELNENKSILNDARAEVAQSKRAVEVCQAEFTAIKKECSKLNADLKAERNEVIKLNEQRRMFLNEIDTLKKLEGELREELNKAKKQLENNKLELRNYYQGQVEILVQNKLKEFQSQLDQAEVTFKEEMKKREMSIAKTAATHIQQISEKYSLEIKLLEKKHQEEIKLVQIQAIQYRQQVETLQDKLNHFQEKRVIIAKQLQKIMESQWTEALRIIASGKSPTFNEGDFSTIDQLNSLKTRSYNNVEEVLSQQHEEVYNLGGKPKTELFLPLQNDETVSSVSSQEKNIKEVVAADTPVSSRVQGSKQFSDSEIQKYINLLLNRPPGNPTQTSSHKVISENIGERGTWTHVRSRKYK